MGKLSPCLRVISENVGEETRSTNDRNPGAVDAVRSGGCYRDTGIDNAKIRDRADGTLHEPLRVPAADTLDGFCVARRDDEKPADRSNERSKETERRGRRFPDHRERTDDVVRYRSRIHRSTFGSPSFSRVSRTILFGLAIGLLCVPVLGIPMQRRHLVRPDESFDFDRGIDGNGLDIFEDTEDTFEDVFQEERAAAPTSPIDDNELEIIRTSIVRGLGLRRIPDPSKANVSQAEYERAHREYLKRVQLSQDEQGSRSRRELHVFHATAHPGNGSTSERETHYRHSLFFPVEIPDDKDATVDHATLRLLLEGHYSQSDLDVLVYLKTSTRRDLIVRKQIQLNSRDSRWLEFDSTVAASSWLEHGLENEGIELEFVQDGQLVRRTVSTPVFNLFTVSEPNVRRRKRSSPEELMSLHKGRRTKCKGENKKCCRHELTVMFKDLKGFEFIVYPKEFDAGYCKGRCPPRYNPAHHHALLQSLLWKEDRKRVPKPCCAPSKLDQLMIVYFDENDSTQLKVSYWKNIQVLECACS